MRGNLRTAQSVLAGIAASSSVRSQKLTYGKINHIKIINIIVRCYPCHITCYAGMHRKKHTVEGRYTKY